MWHSRGSWIVWVVLALVLTLLFMLNVVRQDYEVNRFIGERVTAHVVIDNDVADSAIVIKTGSGAYVVKLSEKEYFVERVEEKWLVGVWVVVAPRESYDAGPPITALVFPPNARTGDWAPKLKVETDLGESPTRISFTMMDGRRIQIDLRSAVTRSY
jgi:hypothetical protein